MTTVTVDATWQIARCEFVSMGTPNGLVLAHGEIVLQEPANPVEGSEFMRQQVRPPTVPGVTVADDAPYTYGKIVGANIARQISEVAGQTIEVDGKTYSFAEVTAVLEAFVEKWRVEDSIQTTPLAMPPVSPT